MDAYNLFFDQGLSDAALAFLQSSAMTAYNTRELGERIQALMKSPYYARQAIGHTMELGMTDTVPLSGAFSGAFSAAFSAAFSGAEPDSNPEMSGGTKPDSASLGEAGPDSRRLLDSLRQVQLLRRSTRSFDDYIDLRQLADCLLNAYFVTERFEEHSHHLARRSIASGGALYPIDLFYIALHTDGLARGIYAFNPHRERLEAIRLIDSEKQLFRSLTRIYPAEVRGSWDMRSLSGILVFAGILNRVACKYGDRGLRFALMDVGSLCQNVHLAAAATDISCCAIGGYMDSEMDRLIGLKGPDETCLLTMFVGKNK